MISIEFPFIFPHIDIIFDSIIVKRFSNLDLKVGF